MRPPQRHEIYSAECRALPSAVREEALGILLERFSASNRTKDNAQIIKRLFGVTQGSQHCFHSRQDVSVNGPIMSGYKCAVAIGHGGHCVGAACFRHVAPRRGPDKKFTELLLLASRKIVKAVNKLKNNGTKNKANGISILKLSSNVNECVIQDNPVK